jgi:hypothetical protein
MGLRRGRLPGTLAGALVGAVLGGCAGGLAQADGRLVDPVHGFSFSLPPPADPAWRGAKVAGTLAAYERAGGARMSVQSECERKPPGPQVQARNLLIGVSPYVIRQAGPVAAGDVPGWSQVVDVGDEGRVRRLRTVTLVTADCTVDFLLVAGDDFESAQPSFEAWWKSFEAGAAARGAGS